MGCELALLTGCVTVLTRCLSILTPGQWSGGAQSSWDAGSWVGLCWKTSEKTLWTVLKSISRGKHYPLPNAILCRSDARNWAPSCTCARTGKRTKHVKLVWQKSEENGSWILSMNQSWANPWQRLSVDDESKFYLFSSCFQLDFLLSEAQNIQVHLIMFFF